MTNDKRYVSNNAHANTSSKAIKYDGQRRDNDRGGEHPENDQENRRLGTAIKKLGNRLFVGEFQLEVLRAISELGHAAYGTEIRNHLEKRQEREVSTPQVYAALTRLSDLGLVHSEEDKSATAGRRGRPRRVYTLKTSGLRMLKAGTDLCKPMSRKEKTFVSTTATAKASSSYTS